MASFKIPLKGAILANIRVLALPLALSLAIILLFIVVFKNGFARISTQLEELKEVSKVEGVLQEKVEVLRQIEGIVLNQADISALAIPEKTPAVLMLAQLSSLAEEHSLVLTDKRASLNQQVTGGLSSMTIDISQGGELNQMVDYILEISKLAPLSTITRVDIKKEQRVLGAKVSVNIYWGDFPTKIPPITEPIKRLTTEEKDLITQLAKLKKPDMVEIEPMEPVDRENPFR